MVAAESLAQRARLLGEIETSSAHLVLRKALEPPDLTAAAPASHTDEPVSHVANVAVPRARRRSDRRVPIAGGWSASSRCSQRPCSGSNAPLGFCSRRPGVGRQARLIRACCTCASHAATRRRARSDDPAPAASVRESPEQPAVLASAPRPSAAPGRAPKPVAAKRSSCNPPYRVDANGIRRIRPNVCELPSSQHVPYHFPPGRWRACWCWASRRRGNDTCVRRNGG